MTRSHLVQTLHEHLWAAHAPLTHPVRAFLPLAPFFWLQSLGLVSWLNWIILYLHIACSHKHLQINVKLKICPNFQFFTSVPRFLGLWAWRCLLEHLVQSHVLQPPVFWGEELHVFGKSLTLPKRSGMDNFCIWKTCCLFVALRITNLDFLWYYDTLLNRVKDFLWNEWRRALSFKWALKEQMLVRWEEWHC